MHLYLEGEVQPSPMPMIAATGLTETAPPPRLPATTGSNTHEFKARLRIYTAESEQRKRDIGLAGELAVLAHEKARLRAVGLTALADQVRHVSAIEGDGAGYDILSFRPDGTNLYVEVKTTTGAAASEFFLSSNEVAFSVSHAPSYELWRVYDFDASTMRGLFFLLPGSAADHFSLAPTQYRASLRLRA